jgi:hypothetical protein
MPNTTNAKTKSATSTPSALSSRRRYARHAIIDTGRNAVQGLRLAWGDWCNVNGAGFGVRPTSTTGDSLEDAFVWVKPGGESDGTSDTTAARYDSFCGRRMRSSLLHRLVQWNEAYFEMLLKNAKPGILVRWTRHGIGTWSVGCGDVFTKEVGVRWWSGDPPFHCSVVCRSLCNVWQRVKGMMGWIWGSAVQLVELIQDRDTEWKRLQSVGIIARVDT